MVRPTSFRLPEDLVFRLDEEAADQQTSVSSLVVTLLDEGLKTRRFPGVVYRDGPTGRRAGLVIGPDLWEVVRDVKRATGRGETRIRRVADRAGLTEAQVRLAVDFYANFPVEIDARIAADERASVRVRERIERREQLLSM
jgi:hypothetical protein